jgi:DNA (cytosine-5)-methyltransferase 1
MKVLDLFSGIGGFALGLEAAGFETAAFCEIDPYAQKVLKKNWPGVPIYDDVRRITADRLVSDGVGVDVITGGFPCQDISVAGNQKGIDAERSGLWSECSRLLGDIRPRYAIFENVTNLLTGDGGDWFKRVLWDISSVGYDAEWHCIPASAIGAYHHRDRVWIVAYPNSDSQSGVTLNAGEIHPPSLLANSSECERQSGAEKQGVLRTLQENGAIYDNSGGRSEAYAANISNPSSEGLQGSEEARNNGKDRQEPRSQLITGLSGVQGGIWATEPSVGRVANGVPARSHRLRCLGNAVVPQIPELIGRQIMEAERGRA